LGFSIVEQTAFSTAILEIARNIVKYAGRGDVILQVVEADKRIGIIVLACDSGPGIEDIELALKDGYSTGKGLGLGLPGAKRLMDSFEIASQPGLGTTIIMQKWKGMASRQASATRNI
jgi:serine/threonine-protein kinase RsbT